MQCVLNDVGLKKVVAVETVVDLRYVLEIKPTIYMLMWLVREIQGLKIIF